MAKKKAGSVVAIISIMATVLPNALLDAIYTGTPMAAAMLKHITCLLVKFRIRRA